MASRNFLTTTTKRAKRSTLLALLFVLGVLTCACDGATKGNGLGAKVSKTEQQRHSAQRSKNLTSSANLGFSLNNVINSIDANDVVDIFTDVAASIVAYYDKWKTSSTSSSSTTSEMTIDFR